MRRFFAAVVCLPPLAGCPRADGPTPTPPPPPTTLTCTSASKQVVGDCSPYQDNGIGTCRTLSQDGCCAIASGMHVLEPVSDGMAVYIYPGGRVEPVWCRPGRVGELCFGMYQDSRGKSKVGACPLVAEPSDTACAPNNLGPSADAACEPGLRCDRSSKTCQCAAADGIDFCTDSCTEAGEFCNVGAVNADCQVSPCEAKRSAGGSCYAGGQPIPGACQDGLTCDPATQECTDCAAQAATDPAEYCSAADACADVGEYCNTARSGGVCHPGEGVCEARLGYDAACSPSLAGACRDGLSCDPSSEKCACGAGCSWSDAGGGCVQPKVETGGPTQQICCGTGSARVCRPPQPPRELRSPPAGCKVEWACSEGSTLTQTALPIPMCTRTVQVACAP